MNINFPLAVLISFLSFSVNLNAQVLLPQKNLSAKPIWSVQSRLPCERFYFQIVQICEGQRFRVVDSFYTRSGTFNNKTVSFEGCDSLITTYLTFIATQRVDTAVTLCLGKCFRVGTKCYAQQGNYTDTLRTRFGCDSIVRLNLTITKPDSTTQNPTICAGERVTVGTRTYTQTGNYRDTVPNADGCSRLIKTNLTVRPRVALTQSPTLCFGRSITVATRTYTQTGVYLDTLKAASGCDSVITTRLTVLPKIEKRLDSTICSGKSVLFGGSPRTATGVYPDVLTAANGCDSTVTLNLTVIPPFTIQRFITLCAGKDTVVEGRLYNQTTTIRDTLKAVSGCDSLVKVLNVTVRPPIETTINKVFCKNETNLVAGTSRATFKALNGCDSVVITIIKINDTFNINQTKEICAGDSLRVGNKFYKNAGNYLDLLKTAAGCDSLVFTTLRILAPLSITQSKTICKGDSLKVGNKNYTVAGTYVDKLISSKGCDSTVTTTLKINELPILDLPRGLNPKPCSDSLELNPKGDTAARYQWAWRTVSCSTCRNPKIKPIQTTTYSVTVTDLTTGCKGKDSVRVQIDETYSERVPNAFTPNGDNLNDVFNVVADDCIKSVLRLQIYNRWGNMIYDKTNLSPRNKEGWDGKLDSNLVASDVCVYVMEIAFVDGTTKKISGEVTLIR